MNKWWPISAVHVRGFIRGTVVALVCLYCFELAAQRFENEWTFEPTHQYEDGASPYLLWELPSGEREVNGHLVQINEYGMRGPEVVQPKPANTRRIVTLGDGVAFCEGVSLEDGFTHQASLLLGDGRVGLEALVMAVPGYGIYQHRNLMDLRGWSLEPDVLLIAGPSSEMDVSKYVDRDVISIYRSGPGAREFWESLALFRVMDHHVRVVDGDVSIERKRIFEGQEHGNLTGLPRVGVNQYAEELNKLAERAVDREVDVVFVLLPTPADLDNTHYSNRVQLYRTAMGGVADRLGIPVVDGAALFWESGRTQDELFLDGSHLTKRGHQTLAAGVAARLRPWMRGSTIIHKGLGGRLPVYREPDLQPEEGL